jgi:hypothetical protein
MASFKTGSTLFNPTAYLALNSDVKAAAGILTGQALSDFAYNHFLNFGAAEGRDPMGMAPTIAAPNTLTAGTTSNGSGINGIGLDVSGAGKATGGLFDAGFYLSTNADVNAAFIVATTAALAAGRPALSAAAFALQHFVQYGAAENRNPSAAFGQAAYENANSDVAGAVTLHMTTGIQHYLQFGETEGRIANRAVALPVVIPEAPSPAPPAAPLIPVIPVPPPGPLLSASTGLTAAQALTIVNTVDTPVTGYTISTAGAAALVTMYNPAGSASVANLLINGIPTLGVVSNTLLPDTLSFNASTTALSHLVLTGLAPITVTPGVTAAQLDTIDASGMGPAANLTLTAGLTKTGAVVTGSNGGDTYTGGTLAAGIAHYNGGTGNDLMKETSAQIEGSNGIGNAFDGGGGVNTLEVTDLGGVQVTLTDVAGQFTNLAHVQNIVLDTNFGATLTTGANFNTNFTAGGVAITAAHLGTVGPTQSSVIDLADTANAGLNKFTGAATIALTTHVTTGNTTVKAGSGPDVVAVTTDLMTTGIVNVTTGNAADTITITSTAPGQANTGGVASDFVINPGAGADHINLLVHPSTLFAGNYVDINIAAPANSPTTAFKVVTGIFISDGTLRLPDEITFGNAPGLNSTTGPIALPGTFMGSPLSFSLTNTATIKGQLTFSGGTAGQLQASDVIAYYNANIATTLGANTTVFYDDATHNHDTYLFDHYGAGSDALVELVGAHVLSLTATTTLTTPGNLVVL